MLKNLKIQNFRGLSDLSLEGLGRFNVLLGANSAGKTSILEAVFLLSGISNLHLPVKIQNFRSLLVKRPEDLANLFTMTEGNRDIYFDARFENGEQRGLSISRFYGGVQEPTLQLDGGRNEDAKKRGNGGQSIISPLSSYSDLQGIAYRATVSRLDEPSTSFAANLQVIPEGGINPPNLPNLQHLIISAAYLQSKLVLEYDAKVIGQALVDKRKSRILEPLQKIDSRIQDIACDGDLAYLDIGLEKMLPLNVFGEGIVNIVRNLAHAAISALKIILIDQIEDGLHYKSMRPFMQTLLKLSKDQNVQLFIATHSIDALETLREILASDESADFRKDALCYYLGRDKEGVIRSYRYDYEQFEHCIGSAIEIR